MLPETLLQPSVRENPNCNKCEIVPPMPPMLDNDQIEFLPGYSRKPVINGNPSIMDCLREANGNDYMWASATVVVGMLPVLFRRSKLQPMPKYELIGCSVFSIVGGSVMLLQRTYFRLMGLDLTD